MLACPDFERVGLRRRAECRDGRWEARSADSPARHGDHHGGGREKTEQCDHARTFHDAIEIAGDATMEGDELLFTEIVGLSRLE